MVRKARRYGGVFCLISNLVGLHINILEPKILDAFCSYWHFAEAGLSVAGCTNLSIYVITSAFEPLHETRRDPI